MFQEEQPLQTLAAKKKCARKFFEIYHALHNKYAARNLKYFYQSYMNKKKKLCMINP